MKRSLLIKVCLFLLFVVMNGGASCTARIPRQDKESYELADASVKGKKKIVKKKKKTKVIHQHKSENQASIDSIKISKLEQKRNARK
jgi:hypothetical protein